MLPRISQALTKFLTPIASSLANDGQNQNSGNSQNSGSPHTSGNPGNAANLSNAEKPQQFQRFVADKDNSNEREKGSDTPDKAPPQLKLVPPLSSDENSNQGQNPLNDKGLASELGAGTQSWIQMFSLFQNHSSRLPHWLNVEAYRTRQKMKKLSGNYRKGAMLDYKAE